MKFVKKTQFTRITLCLQYHHFVWDLHA